MRRHGIKVHKIQISGWLYQKLELETLTFKDQQSAINELEIAFEKHKMYYIIKNKDNKICFYNEHGGELAAVVKG